MITLTKLNSVEILLNPDLIEQVEETPDTFIMLTTGQGIRVRESMEQVRQKVIAFRRATGQTGPHGTPIVPRQGSHLHAEIIDGNE